MTQVVRPSAVSLADLGSPGLDQVDGVGANRTLLAAFGGVTAPTSLGDLALLMIRLARRPAEEATPTLTEGGRVEASHDAEKFVYGDGPCSPDALVRVRSASWIPSRSPPATDCRAPLASS